VRNMGRKTWRPPALRLKVSGRRGDEAGCVFREPFTSLHQHKDLEWGTQGLNRTARRAGMEGTGAEAQCMTCEDRGSSLAY